MNFKQWFIKDNVLYYNVKAIPFGWTFSGVVEHIKKTHSIVYLETYGHRQLITIKGDSSFKYLSAICLVKEKDG